MAAVEECIDLKIYWLIMDINKLTVGSCSAGPSRTEPSTASTTARLSGNLATVSSTSRDVPNKIHHFWQGNVAACLKLADNLKAVASRNPGYRTRLHLLPSRRGDIEKVRAALAGTEVKVKNIENEKWFRNFQKSERYAQFEESRNGERPHYASGADIIKSELLQKKGGIWNDLDNQPLAPLPASLTVSNNEVLTAGPVKFTRWGGGTGVHASTLATHKNNDMLAEMNKSSFKKYNALKGVIYNKNTQTDDPDRHFKMISETAGSLHFSRELMARDKAFRKEVMDLQKSGKTSNNSRIIFNQYLKPTASTGVGELDDDQTVSLLQSLSPPGHVVI